MPKFLIYPKKGTMFTIECQSIKRNEKGFALLSGNQEGFVFLENVAAITLERLVDEGNEIDNIWFDVCLKGHSKPAKVFAHSFKTGLKIIFKNMKRDDQTKHHSERPIEDIYIDPSEVVAIAPSTFFKS